MKRRMIVLCIAFALILAGGLGGSALTGMVMAEAGQSEQIPQVINYQGFLTDKSTEKPLTGAVNITFSLYTGATSEEAAVPVWTETHQDITLDEGRFSVLLGSITSLDPSVFTGATYLGIAVNGEAEMAPRVQLASVPYAANADTLDGIDSSGFSYNTHTHDQRYVEEAQPDSITAEMIQTDAVTSDKVSFNYAGSSSEGGKANDADLFDGLNSDQFMRSDIDAATSGSLSVGGTLTASQVEYQTPQTRYLYIDACGMVPMNSDSSGSYSINNWAGLRSSKAYAQFVAVVNLPDGAVVTNVTFKFKLLETPSNADGIHVAFCRASGGYPWPVEGAEVDASGFVVSNNYPSKVVSLNETIDNSSKSYCIAVDFPNGSDGVGFTGAVITYQVSEVQ